MKYSVTDVNAYGASTATYGSLSDALSRYALCRADPAVLHTHVAQGTTILKQFIRDAASGQSTELVK